MKKCENSPHSSAGSSAATAAALLQLKAGRAMNTGRIHSYCQVSQLLLHQLPKYSVAPPSARQPLWFVKETDNTRMLAAFSPPNVNPGFGDRRRWQQPMPSGLRRASSKVWWSRSDGEQDIGPLPIQRGRRNPGVTRSPDDYMLYSQALSVRSTSQRACT